MTIQQNPEWNVYPTNPFILFDRAAIEQSISNRFEQMVNRYPNQTAIKFKNQAITYDDLNRLANRLARTILDRDGPEAKPVALLLEHDIAMIAAILGVLKAGKIYVPLDPSHPPARLNYILNDCQAGLVITSRRNLNLASTLIANDNLNLLNLDELDPAISEENVALAISPDRLAYIIYTSGSTGQPKGVPHNHRNLLQYMRLSTNGLHFSPDDRYLLLFSYSFSASITPTFGSLLNGATLYLYDLNREGVTNLATCLLREEITIFHSTPTLFRTFSHTLTGNENFSKLRLVKLGGEAIYPQDVTLFNEHFSPGCVFNIAYGSTEANAITWCCLKQGTRLEDNPIPVVGYPVEDKDILLLDETGKPAGAGQIGEIAIRSCYLSPGYWGRPDLDQAKFLPDPEGGSKRIYLTGDLGRIRPDGCLEYLGRKDSQVKIRAYRVELAEIEIALHQMEAVKEAVVVAHQDPAGNSYLVAYVLPTGQPAPSPNSLRQALSPTLPDYMFPTFFIMLESLPLTPTGKVDRLALPKPDRIHLASTNPYMAPENEIEAQLVTLWEDLLEMKPIGRIDNFFELGGNSLSAMQIISRIRDNFKIELSVRTVFEAPTIRELSQIIIANEAKPKQSERIAQLLKKIREMPAEDREKMLQARRNQLKDQK